MNKLLRKQLQLVITTIQLIIDQLPNEPGDDSDIPRPGDKEKFDALLKSAVATHRKERKTLQEVMQPDLLSPLQPRTLAVWSEQEIHAVMENARNLRPLNSGLPGRTKWACRGILKRNKISLQSIYAKIPNLPPSTGRSGFRQEWTPEEDRKLFDNWRKGLELEDGLGGRNRNACKIRFATLEKKYPDGKIPEAPNRTRKNNGWTPEEDKILKHNYDHHLPINHTLPARTKRACEQRYYSTLKE